jgi:hypothetical protein
MSRLWGGDDADSGLSRAKVVRAPAAGEGLVRRGVRPYALRRAMQALISHAARQGRLLARPFFLASSKRKLRRPRPGDKFSRRPRVEASSGGRRLLRAPRSMKNRARGPLAACEGVYVGDPLAHPEIGLGGPLRSRRGTRPSPSRVQGVLDRILQRTAKVVQWSGVSRRQAADVGVPAPGKSCP